MKILIACALVAAPAHSFAQGRAHNPQQVSDALKAGCSVQQTHLQAGRIGSTPAIVRCPATQPAFTSMSTPNMTTPMSHWRQ